jgi:hypothetical protein
MPGVIHSSSLPVCGVTNAPGSHAIDKQSLAFVNHQSLSDKHRRIGDTPRPPGLLGLALGQRAFHADVASTQTRCFLIPFDFLLISRDSILPVLNAMLVSTVIQMGGDLGGHRITMLTEHVNPSRIVDSINASRHFKPPPCPRR